MGISRPTAHKWIRRWRAEGEAGLDDRPSKPRTTPHRTPPAVEARVCRLRTDRKLDPARIGPVLGLPASTLHRILARHGLNRLAWLDRPTGAIVRRYERARPGELVHVDIKKLGNIPDGGGHKVMERRQAMDDKLATTDRRRSCSEVLTDERKETAAGFWQRANAFFAAPGITRKKIRPYRPQTNGKVERFNRTLLDEWAYQRPYRTNDERTQALADFLHT